MRILRNSHIKTLTYALIRVFIAAYVCDTSATWILYEVAQILQGFSGPLVVFPLASQSVRLAFFRLCAIDVLVVGASVTTNRGCYHV